MTYPPGPNNPYGKQPPQGQLPQQPQQPYGYPQQPPAGAPQPQPGYGYPQQPPFPQQQGYPGGPGGGYPAPGYGQGGYPGGPVPGMPPFASWGARLGALLVDALIFNLVPMILLIVGYAQIISATVNTLKNCDTSGTSGTCDTSSSVSGGAIALVLLGVLLNIVASLVMCYLEGSKGYTPGKKALGIMVLREADGRPLGFGMAFVRRLCHGLDAAACYIGFLWPLWDAKKQTFADKIIKSVVVKTK